LNFTLLLFFQFDCHDDVIHVSPASKISSYSTVMSYCNWRFWKLLYTYEAPSLVQ